MPADLDLAVNCGSSSIKFSLYKSGSDQVVVQGSASNVAGDSPAKYKYSFMREGGKSDNKEKELESQMSYEDIFKEILRDVTQPEVLGDEGKARIRLVAHRIVHGGTADDPIVIRHGDKEEQETLDQMEAVSAFAPLHNHHAMLIVKECLEHLPDAYSVLCFDTLFHQTIPQFRRTYAISQPEHKTPVPLVKYGFHGLSYANIRDQMAEALGKPKDAVNLVVAHLGSGGSCCLIRNGKSVQTTMGVTPLEGLPGGTRSGTLDPSLIFHHTPDCSTTVKWSGRDISKAEYVLNKESGFRALCGTNNFGVITSRAFPSEGDTEQPSHDDHMSSRLTYQLYLDHLLAFLSDYVTDTLSSAPQLDALVFSGGIGERSSRLRADVLSRFRFIEELAQTQGGVDKAANEQGQGRREITKKGSKVPAWVVETSEEDEMVRMAEEALQAATSR
ncbi:putative acetate kinase [Rhodotorula sp. JG-1b]|nr:putative acetate kinase [Rhodotorula sp. JG-1b]